MNRAWYAAGVVALGFMLGCGGESLPEGETAIADAPAPPAPTPPGRPAASSDDEPSTGFSFDADAAPDESSDAAEMPAEESIPVEDASDETAGETRPAEVGVGVKGSDYGGPGFVTTPVEAYFRTGERIAFEIQIPSAMKIYKASHDNKGPKTHEEFMEVIIRENGIQLPELRAEEEFLYDPKTEQLLVRRPAE